MVETSLKTSRFVERGFIKGVLSKIILAAVYLGLIYGLIALVYASRTLFKVKQNYAVVLERLGGVREAVTEVGWHGRLPFFTRIEQEVPLMNQTLFLGSTMDPVRIISRENVTLWTSGVLTYRIRDLHTWAIENLNPLDLLQGDYDGIVKDNLQAHEVNQLISGREKIKEEIFRALKSRPINEGGPTLEQKYGIEVVSFVLKETRFGDNLIEASEEKKRRELIAEGENYAADQEASRINKLYTAYLKSIQALQKGLGKDSEVMDVAILHFLVQQKWAAAYEKNQTGQNTVVIQNTENSPGINITPQMEKVQIPVERKLPVKKRKTAVAGAPGQNATYTPLTIIGK
ncbi:MAG: SPFH domain-containing protein [Proteobacteria bacterium]|nr:SPFH domain-containing protein [Pseudomonadota bacterium]